MLFNSFDYLSFLALVFVSFWALSRFRLLRALLLLGASYVFYMSWNASFVLLILASTVLDYLCGLALGKAGRPITRKLVLGASLTGNLGILVAFKYADFFIDSAAAGLALTGLHVEPAHLGLILPVGISFYTFQTLSYTLDIYKGELQPTKNFFEFALFVAFFPQLVAGPIVRAKEFLPQFERRPSLDQERAWSGVFLIAKGLAKKILIADFLAANLLDRVFDSPNSAGSLEVLVALYGYTWQIYGDFSGYTDIARGSARLVGFELPENFKRPFASQNLAEFWRRWHITLTRWFTDYLYVPLGGAKKGVRRTYVNVAITFLVVGLWHGAAWNFVIFGAWHALGLVLYRAWKNRQPANAAPPSPFKKAVFVFLTLHFHVLNWPVFRADSLEQALSFYSQIFAFELAPFNVPPSVILVIVGCFIVHYTPRDWVDRLEQWTAKMPTYAQATALAAAATLMIHVSSSAPAPFIYFQF